MQTEITEVSKEIIVDSSLVEGNPRWQRVQEIADMFYMIAETRGRDKELDMKNAGVDSGPVTPCGTVCCHAGEFELFTRENDSVSSHYKEGSRRIEKHLGVHCLGYWAGSNRDLWGNPEGYFMFSFHATSKTFGGKPTEPITFNLIAKHWQGVANRLRKLQESSK